MPNIHIPKKNYVVFLRYNSSSKINIGERNVVPQDEGLSRSTGHSNAYCA